LEKEGKIIHPRPAALEIIRDKGLQKIFYSDNNFPTSTFKIYENKKDIKENLKTQNIDFPFVWKSRRGGYDGKGVAVVRSAETFDLLPDVPCVVEELVEIEQEIAVIAARTWADTEGGENCLIYDCVEMEFDPQAHLLDLQLCPANISEDIAQKAKMIAQSLIEKLDIYGLLAVEMFITKSGEILVNEVAPRAHNSGHHTIEAAATSQFEQHIRGVVGLPLGDVRTLLPSVMFNLLGADGFAGRAQYVGFGKALHTEGVGIHLYGKAETRPYRKMGHVTVLAKDIKTAYQTAIDLKESLKIIAK
jgi:5-(carboxyamino)imidazole ribonucleotide synthase